MRATKSMSGDGRGVGGGGGGDGGGVNTGLGVWGISGRTLRWAGMSKSVGLVQVRQPQGAQGAANEDVCQGVWEEGSVSRFWGLDLN